MTTVHAEVSQPENAAPRAALGTMNFGQRTDEKEATAIVERAYERGVRVFDTANLYTDGRSERILGRALGKRRAAVQVATKVGLARVNGKVEGLSADTLRRSLDESLARLGMDHVDIFYLHAPDRATPLSETLAALAELVGAGKIRAFGVSNFASYRCVDLLHLADAAGAPRPVISQVLYNVLVRQVELEHLQMCREKGLAVTVYNALAGGLLSGRHASVDAIEKGSRFDGNRLYQRRYWTARLFEHVAALRAVADEAGLSLLALAYGWLATRPIDSVLVGPATVQHLDDALDALARPLAPDLVKRLEELHRDFQGTDASYAR